MRQNSGKQQDATRVKSRGFVMLKGKQFCGRLVCLLMVLPLGACGKASTGVSASDPPAAGENTDVSISWWGADDRHRATRSAVEAFEAAHPEIHVTLQFGAWEGWEEKMAAAFYADTAADINQINWNWITSFSADGSKFKDLRAYSEQFDFSQYDPAVLADCTVADELQAIPVSLTGRIFYWNKTAFSKAGLEVPRTLAALYDAGEVFRERLGEDCYPLALGEYDRMLLLVYYLESVYGKPWVTGQTLNYAAAELEQGLAFIRSLEERHVIPPIRTLLGDGAISLDKNQNWIAGRYGGIFEWDSAAAKYREALGDSGELVVGNYFSDIGSYQGGFSKVSLAFAVSERCAYPRSCMLLLDFLLNGETGAALLADTRGVPLSAAARKTCEDKGLLSALSVDANRSILDWVRFPPDISFEDARLKSNPDGAYFDVMSGLSYGDYSVSEAAVRLEREISAVLSETQ